MLPTYKAWRLLQHSPRGGAGVRITFHVKKHTVTIIIEETHKKDRGEKTSATLASDGVFVIL